MKRRDVLKYVAFATGTAISSPLLTSFLSERATDYFITNEHYKPMFFNEQEFMLLVHLSNAILPKTDSPSASEVGVPGTIDSIVFNVFTSSDQISLRRKFSALDVYLRRKNFLKSDQIKKVEILEVIESGQQETSGLISQAYFDLKQQIIAYYLSSEEIGENYLNYLPVPGYYDPCITLESVNGKAWSI